MACPNSSWWVMPPVATIAALLVEIAKILISINWGVKHNEINAALRLLQAKDIEEKKDIVKELGDAWAG